MGLLTVVGEEVGGWVPGRLRRRERRGGGVEPRQHVAERRAVHQPSLVREQLLHRQQLLAAASELRPVLADGLGDVDEAAIDQLVHRERHHPLGGGEDVDQRVLLPGGAALGIGHAAPDVDDGLALEGDRTAGAGLGDIAAVGKVLGKCGAHGLPPGGDEPADVGLGEGGGGRRARGLRGRLAQGVEDVAKAPHAAHHVDQRLDEVVDVLVLPG